jgi:hypothetical protein
MKFRLPILLALCTLACRFALAQGDDGETPLGDLARNLRKNKAQQEQQQPADSTRPVIDNENFSQALEDVHKARPEKTDKTVLSIDGATNTVKVSSPDVTCSLSFNARASSLFVKPVLIEDLPLTDLLKIDGPGSIQDQALQLDIFNGTDWDIREITIGLTLERKPGENAKLAARARVIPAVEGLAPPALERRSDVTLLYHLKTEAKPFTTTSFHENIGITPGPDEDWRWSIVEARGVRPASVPVAPDSLQEPLFAPSASFVPDASQTQAVQPSPLDAGKTDSAPTTPAVPQQ